jgi:hypothetical protein
MRLGHNVGARQFWICTARYNFQDLAASNNGDCVQLPGDIGRPSLTETSDVRAVTGSVAISAFLPVLFIEPTSGEVQFCIASPQSYGSPRMIVIVGRTCKRAKAVATDLRYGAPLCLKTTVVDGDYDHLAEAYRRHRSLRQYHDHQRPITLASLALASWGHGSRNRCFAMSERSFRSEVTIKTLAKTLASSGASNRRCRAGSGGRWRRAPPI